MRRNEATRRGARMRPRVRLPRRDERGWGWKMQFKRGAVPDLSWAGSEDTFSSISPAIRDGSRPSWTLKYDSRAGSRRDA